MRKKFQFKALSAFTICVGVLFGFNDVFTHAKYHQKDTKSSFEEQLLLSNAVYNGVPSFSVYSTVPSSGADNEVRLYRDQNGASSFARISTVPYGPVDSLAPSPAVNLKVYSFGGDNPNADYMPYLEDTPQSPYFKRNPQMTFLIRDPSSPSLTKILPVEVPDGNMRVSFRAEGTSPKYINQRGRKPLFNAILPPLQVIKRLEPVKTITNKYLLKNSKNYMIKAHDKWHNILEHTRPQVSVLGPNRNNYQIRNYQNPPRVNGTKYLLQPGALQLSPTDNKPLHSYNQAFPQIPQLSSSESSPAESGKPSFPQNPSEPFFSEEQRYPTYPQYPTSPFFSEEQGYPTYPQYPTSPFFSEEQGYPTSPFFSGKQGPPSFPQYPSSPSFSEEQGYPTYSQYPTSPFFSGKQGPPSFPQYPSSPSSEQQGFFKLPFFLRKALLFKKEPISFPQYPSCPFSRGEQSVPSFSQYPPLFLFTTKSRAPSPPALPETLLSKTFPSGNRQGNPVITNMRLVCLSNKKSRRNIEKAKAPFGKHFCEKRDEHLFGDNEDTSSPEFYVSDKGNLIDLPRPTKGLRRFVQKFLDR